MSPTKLHRKLFTLLSIFLLSQFLHSCGLVDEPTSSTTCIANCSSTTTSVPTADSSPTTPSLGAQAVGVFKDGAVAGITFQSSSGLAGTTNSSGEFDYRGGDTVSFSLGGIDLGSVTGAAVLTPVEVMEATGTADPKVVNFARFLQSIDEDGDPSNGINVTAGTSSTFQNDQIDFDQPVAAFAEKARTLVSKAYSGRELISESDALNHLHSTLEDEGKADKVSPPDQFVGIVDNYTPEVDQWPLLLDAGIGPSNLFVDSNGQVYLAQEGPSNNCAFTITKYNSKRTVQWENALCGQVPNVGGVAPTVDTDGNLYALTGGLAVEADPPFAIVTYNSQGIEISSQASSCSAVRQAVLKNDGSAYLWGNCGGEGRSIVHLDGKSGVEDVILNEKDFSEVSIFPEQLTVDGAGNLFWLNRSADFGAADPSAPPTTGNDVLYLHSIDTKRNHSVQQVLRGSTTAAGSRLIPGKENYIYLIIRENQASNTYGYVERIQKYTSTGPVWTNSVEVGIPADSIEIWAVAVDKNGDLLISGTLKSVRTDEKYSFLEKRSGTDGRLLRRKWLEDKETVYSIAISGDYRFYTLNQTERGETKVAKWSIDNLTEVVNNPKIVVNQRPIAEQIGPFEFERNSTNNLIQLQGSDPENDTISFTIDPYSNSIGTLSWDGTDRINYTPAADFVGTDSFRYYVTDYYGAFSEKITVSIKVTGTLPEPEYSVDNFTVVADNSSTISNMWDLYPDNGSQAPQGFLLICSADNDTQPPTDNISLADDPDCSDGSGVVNLTNEVNSYTWTNLQGATQYFFKIFAFTNKDQPEYIDYLTSGNIQSGGTETPSANLPIGVFCGGEAEWSCDSETASRFDEAVFAE